MRLSQRSSLSWKTFGKVDSAMRWNRLSSDSKRRKDTWMNFETSGKRGTRKKYRQMLNCWSILSLRSREKRLVLLIPADQLQSEKGYIDTLRDFWKKKQSPIEKLPKILSSSDASVVDYWMLISSKVEPSVTRSPFFIVLRMMRFKSVFWNRLPRTPFARSPE